MHDHPRNLEYIPPREHRQRFPQHRPTPERQPKGENVTIAACFRFDEGILFCADTKITRDTKTEETKLFPRIYGGREAQNYCATVFAMSGTVSYAKAAIEDCESRLSTLDFLRVSMNDVRQEIASALADFHQEHVYPDPEMQNSRIDLLAGVWLRGKTQMFLCNKSAVSPVSDYGCIGTGSYLAEFWIKIFFSSKDRFDQQSRTLKDIAIISTFAVSSAMEHDEYCGGKEEFFVMRNSGVFDVEVSLYPFEDLPGKIHRAIWPMLRKLSRAADSMDVYSATEEFVQEVNTITQKGGEWLDHISDALRKSVEGSEMSTVKPMPGGPLEAALGGPTEPTGTDVP